MCLVSDIFVGFWLWFASWSKSQVKCSVDGVSAKAGFYAKMKTTPVGFCRSTFSLINTQLPIPDFTKHLPKQPRHTSSWSNNPSKKANDQHPFAKPPRPHLLITVTKALFNVKVYQEESCSC